MEVRDGGARYTDFPTQGPLPGIYLATEFHQTREGFLEEVMLPPDFGEGQTQREKRRHSPGFEVASS